MQNKIATVFSNFKIENTSTVLGSISQANQQAIAGHQLRFDDNVKHPTVNLHSYRDMDITAHGEHKTTVGKNMTTTVTQGNYLQQTEKDLHLYSDKGIHLINGQSRMSITPTDITIESDEIGFHGPKPVEKKATIVNHPTPAPASIIGNGTCDYYKWRYQNFLDRHKDDEQTPPDYYLDYGYKYCHRFSKYLYPNLSSEGKIWLVKARKYLQQDIEKLLKEHPNIELNNEKFREAVFKTHPQAYMRAGFAELPVHDYIKIGATPDLDTWFKPDAANQIRDILVKMVPYCKRLTSTEDGKLLYETLHHQVDKVTKNIFCKAVVEASYV